MTVSEGDLVFSSLRAGMTFFFFFFFFPYFLNQKNKKNFYLCGKPVRELTVSKNIIHTPAALNSPPAGAPSTMHNNKTIFFSILIISFYFFSFISQNLTRTY